MGKSRYQCKYGHTKIVSMDPDRRNPSIRTGCDVCGKICEHRPVGSVYAAGWVQQ